LQSALLPPASKGRRRSNRSSAVRLRKLQQSLGEPCDSWGNGQAESAAVRYWIRAVSEAAIPFESRWTWAALKRVDPDLHDRLHEQCKLFDYTLGTRTGSVADIKTHGAATCRGYAKAFQMLQNAAEPDNAYQLGQDPRTGFQVAIGHQKAVAERVRELHGEDIVWITADEVAAIVANLEAFKAIAAIKQLFPGAEFLDVRPRYAAATTSSDRS
jgi:hypothetical protein